MKTALFVDVGGVLLTNGWDRGSRQMAAERFGLDWDEFQERHELVVSDFDTGRIGLEEYLDRTVFAEPRDFTRDTFKTFMWEQSRPYPEALEFLAELAQSRKYLLATLNNESRELNQYRIRRFHLTDYFTLFFSSCFLGVRKPDEKIYRLVLEVTQHSPGDCLFVDDRALNVECARRVGMRAIQYRNVAGLREELRRSEMTDHAGM
ncbi:MAG TPA: HAD family phosphatase [Bryobacteraceae bacterium]|nr:HAD family phosphatase [Bryobacteraceae bacterium]